MAFEESLREALDRVMRIELPLMYRRAFAKVEAEYGHSIRMLEADPAWLRTFNCYAFALGLAEHPRYQGLVAAHQNSALASSAFVAQLLANGNLQEIDQVQPGDIALYLVAGSVAHAAVIAVGEGRLHSKWGPNELYDHALWEVPASYGSEVRFFRRPPVATTIDLLEAGIA